MDNLGHWGLPILEYLDNGSFWTTQFVYQGWYRTPNLGLGMIIYSPPVILGYDVIRRYNESRNLKLLIQMQLERDELTWNFPVQDRSSWGNIPPGQITLMNILVGYFCLDIWSFCHLQNLVYYLPFYVPWMKGGFKSVGYSRSSLCT